MKATLKPEEIKARAKSENSDPWKGMQERGAVLRREAMATEAKERKDAGLPPERQGEAKGMSQ